MKPSKNIVIAALGVFSLAVSVVAWKSYWKAAELEAASLGNDSADLRRQLAEAQKRRVVEVASTRSATSKEDVAADGATETRPANGPGQNGGRGRGGRGGEMEAVMAKPEMQHLMALQQKAALDGRYGALFKTLALSGDKLATFKELLAEKEATMMDTMRVAREQGSTRAAIRRFKKLMATTQASTNAAIKAAIGDTAFAEYEHYQATQPQRAVVSQLQQSLSYTSEPLTTAQSEQLVQVLASTATATTGEGGRGGGGGRGGPAGIGGTGAGGGGGTGGSVVITAATVTQAQTVLSSTQMQALQDLQALQQAQQQAQKIMREAGAGGPPAGGRG